jgi:hypothetical protein
MRKMNRIAYITMAMCLPMFAAGCANRLGDFTVLATKNVDLARFNSEKGENSPEVTGYDSKPIIFIFSTGVPNLKEAVDRAEESGNAMALTNAVVYKTDYWVLFFGDHRFDVKGNPIKR